MIATFLVLASLTAEAPPLPTFGSTRIVDELAPLPRGITSFGAAELDGWIYVIGGYHGPVHAYSREAQSRAFQRLNRIDGKTWELVGELDRGVQSVALVRHARTLIRVGGLIAHNAAGEPMVLESTATCARFDPAIGRWEALPDMPSGRSSHAAVVCGERLFVVGGWRASGELGKQSTWFDEAWSLDLSEPESGWSSHPQPFRRRGLAAAELAGRLVVIGGMDPDGEESSAVDVLDPLAGSWTSAAELPAPAFGAAAATVEGLVCASASDGRVWTLSSVDSPWRPLTELRFRRQFHQLASTGDGDVVALGGTRSGRAVLPIELVRMRSAERARDIDHWVIPAPSVAKNRQACFLADDSLYFFGGNRSLEQHDFGPESFLREGWRFDLAMRTWERLADLPIARQSSVVEASGRTASIVGGFGHDGESARSFAEGFVYDIEGDLWRGPLDVLATPRTQFGLASHGGATWLLGGLDYDPRRGDDAFRFPLEVLLRTSADDPFADSGLRLPRARRAFGSVLLADRYYMIGGLADGFASVETCDVLDLRARSWSTIPSPARARISPELVALGDRLVLGGGSTLDAEGEMRADSTIEIFDPATERWRVAIDSLPIDPTHMRMFAYRGRVLIASTHDAEHQALHLVWIDVE